MSYKDIPRLTSMALNTLQVSYEDMERLKSLAVMENVRIPHFLQDQARYDKQLQKIMKVNQLTDEELQALMWAREETPLIPTSTWPDDSVR